jgi:cytochrome bd-type quinol oxidase subunit 2
MGGGTGRRRIVLTGTLLLGLLAAVGLASRAHTAAGGGRTRLIDSDILLEYTLLLIVAAAVVIIPVTVYAFVNGRREEQLELPPRRNWMLAVLLTMTGFAVISIVLLASGYFKRHHGSPSAQPLKPLIDLANRGARAPRAVRFDWGPVIVVSVLAAAGLGAGVLMVSRRRPARTRGVADALVLALDETLEDLHADLDPRSAVIAAYAHMERVLAQCGLPRSPSESTGA